MDNLYDSLMALSEDKATPFYHVDHMRYGDLYRVFSYHFTDNHSWKRPDSLESRGIMFELDKQTFRPIRIASRPPHKFFNAGEVSFIDYGKPKYVMNKADGSLISSFLDSSGELRLKSKTSIDSVFANTAMKLLEQSQHRFLQIWLRGMESSGWTVNMELVSPDNRVIVGYDEPRLVVLNARQRDTGQYYPFDMIPSEYFVGTQDVSVLDDIKTATNIEGYVVIDDKGEWTKHKCDWYLLRHKAKNFVETPRAFMELVLLDESDDVLALMHDQPEVLKELESMKHKVVTTANTFINDVTSFYAANKHLKQKEYAMNARKELESFEFSLAMIYYKTGKEPDWTEHFVRSLKRVDWLTPKE